MQLVQAISERFHRWRGKLATGGVAVFALYVGFHVVFGPNGMVVYQHKKAEHQRLLQEVQEMQVENKRLEQGIQNLKSDPKTIEKEAREQLKYAKPGEVVFVMPAPKVEQLPATSDNRPPK
jgi:cell division protein FtsB